MAEKKQPILKGKQIKTRILRPKEYEVLREGAGKLENQTILDTCLLLGARYEECRRIQKNPAWFDGAFIHLSSEVQKKVKRKQVERWIRLSSMGKAILPYFFETRDMPFVQAWNENLLRWSRRVDLNPVGITARSLRKTYESWLIFSFPMATNLIYLSQGHTTLTSLQHYINLPFLDEDKKLMKQWVEGWI